MSLIDPNAELGRYAALVGLEVLDLDEGLVRVFQLDHRIHADLLDQTQFVGAHRVQRINQVVGVAMGRRIAQRAQGIQARDGLLAEVGFEVLRFVQDHDGVRGLDELDGRHPGFAHLVDDIAPIFPPLSPRGRGAGREGAGILGEGVDVNDQNLNGIRKGEMAKLVHSGRVVHHELGALVIVERLEMLPGDLQALQHALADRHRRHHDDELLEAVGLCQLVNRAQIDVGLAGAGLHLHREVGESPDRRAVIQLHGFQSRRRLDAVCVLDSVQIFQPLRVGDDPMVGDAGLSQLEAG